ncbi:MAG TPA: hypothetical protein VII02_09655 [Gemmatimonadaceae bacterium]
MRKTTRFVLIGTAGLIAAACSGKDKAMSDDLKKDLDVASSSDGIALATPAAKGSQVVSAIERTNPPAPRQVAQSQRVVKHQRAPVGPPAPVEAQKATVSEEVAPQPVAVAPAPTEQAPAASPRPRPIDMPSGSGMPEGNGGGMSAGRVLGGIISVVLRGGGVDGDNCDPRTEGRHGGRYPGSINDRLPPFGGRYPGSGRRF